MAVTLTIFWDDAGTVIPGGSALYAAVQPIANYDNWFNYNVVADMQKIIDDFQFELNGSVLRATAATGYSNDFVIGSPQLDCDGNAAHDARMFFDKGKAAFRVGDAIAGCWDVADIGTYSCAVGHDTTASGDQGSCAEGVATLASGSHGSHAEGLHTTASGDYGSHAEGSHTTASGDYGSHAEGQLTIASGHRSHAGGVYSEAYLYAQHARASGRFATNGDAQLSNLVAQIETTDATADVETFLDGISERAVLPSNRTWAFTINVAARQTGGAAGTIGHSAAYELKGVIERTGANTRILGSPTVQKNTIIEDNASWDVTVVADDANEALVVKVTGALNMTIHWAVAINLVEVG